MFAAPTSIARGAVRPTAALVFAFFCALQVPIVAAASPAGTPAGTSPSVGDPAPTVRWRNPAAAAPRPQDAVELRASLRRLGARSQARHAVVGIRGTLDAAGRARLEERGVRLLSYLGDGSWFARVEAGVDPARAADAAPLAFARPIPVAAKLHPDLDAGVVHPWTVVRPRQEGEAGKGKQPIDPDPLVAVHVLFHGDVAADPAAGAILARHGGKVRSFIRSLNGVTAHLPASRVKGLAAEDAVMYVEPPLPALTEVNDSNRPRVEAEELQEAPYELDGAGVTVLVFDGGRMFEHGDFAGRLTIGPRDTSGVSDHATHVGGTIGGDGAGSGGQYRGMAPAVDIVSYGFEQPGGLQQGFLYTDPGDIEADYTEAIVDLGADLANNSIGTNTAPNGYPCEWEGNYGVTGALIDAIARGSLGDPFRIVWANGNERGSGRCGTTYRTTAPPACAKNHITVGALNSNDDSVTSFTSWGPADDGRLKPDISAPGCEAGNDGGVTSTSSSGGYNSKCGTSMASPTVAGLSALLLDQYRRSFPGDPDPRNSTLKAILAQTAEDVGNPGPDYQTGYGSVRGTTAVDLIAEGRFIEADVAQGQTYAFIVVVEPGAPRLQVTIAWDDPPGTPNVDPVLVNDLDLRVVGGDGTIYFPWTLDPDNPGDPAVRTARDGRNNIEQVTIDAPAPGAYRVEVEGFAIPEGPEQTFSAAAAPSLINCAPQGVLSVDRARVTCEDTLHLEVIDCDLNADDGLVETTSVQALSDSEPAGESLLLTETAPESAAFAVSLPVSATDAPGTLQVAHGDSIGLSYVDADDGLGGIDVPRNRQVAVDCVAPLLASISVVELEARRAVVRVEADEPIRATVRYGATCGAPEAEEQRTLLAATQDLRLDGLEPNTTYTFDVQAVDEAGNPTADDNQGGCYTFTTPDAPDLLTEQFTSGTDLAGQLLTLTPDGSIDFYAFCMEPLGGALPTDPTGGVDLGMGDDDAEEIVFADGAEVALYGTSYGSAFVASNGFLTFGDSDTTYNESLSGHFSLPRISALFDDFNPTTLGTVSWKQEIDRVVVTWEDVPEYSTTNSSTFQIELWFDGTIRIAWLELAANDGIAGLSAGTGLDPDFFPTDFSDDAYCGPRPPRAIGQSAATAANTPVQLALEGTDDGLPGGPLRFAIASLPAAGTLVDDATGIPVTVAPHLLSSSAPTLTYTPATDYQGGDAFAFTVDDGGVAPEGGMSGPGAVQLQIGGPTTIYEFLADDTDPGWQTTGDWAFGVPTGGGSNAGDPTSGATGLNVYGYNLAGDYPDNMDEETLTAGPFDLTGRVGTSVTFQRWLGVESATYDHATFRISDDGAAWTDVWDHSGGAVDDGAWVEQTFDVSQWADDRPAVWLQWVMGTTDGSVTYAGWNLDDVSIRGIDPLAGDCDPGDPDVHRSPLPVVNLRVDAAGGAPTTITWNDQSLVAGPGTTFELLTGAVDGVGADLSAATCLQSGTAVEHIELRPDPAPGNGVWYLGRAWNACGASSMGNATRDALAADGDANGAADVCQ